MDFLDNKINSKLGFTLIELIIVIALLSIIALMTTHYIVSGTQIYTNTVERDKGLSNARFVSQRMTREMTHALPNSISVINNCLTFTPIIVKASYDKYDFPIAKFAVKGSISTIADYQYHKGDKAVVDLQNINELNNPQKVNPIKGINTDKNKLYFYDPVSFISASAGQYIYIINKNTSYYFNEQNKLFRGSDCSNGVLMAENLNGHFSMINNLKDKPSSIQARFNVFLSDQELPFVQSMPVNE